MVRSYSIAVESIKESITGCLLPANSAIACICPHLKEILESIF